MKMATWMVLAGTALCTQAAEPNRELAAGHDYYAAAEFRKAAAAFQVPCNINDDAGACYWTGLSYQRLADIRMPFGCRTNLKAHDYLRKATNLAPGNAMYRDALFDFLLEDGDCSRTALHEAARLLSEVPQSDPESEFMRIRIEQITQRNSSADEHLGALLLIVPRATYRTAVVAGSVLQLALRPK